MEGKVIKRLTMLSLVSIFTLCAAVASANAQLSGPIRAKIPFDLNVGDKKQVFSGGEQEGNQLPESRSERTIRRQLAQSQQGNMSGKVMKVETVEIVASLF